MPPQVHFTMYLISDTSRHLRHARHQPHGSPARPASFDVAHFKEQVQRLQLRGQSFHFAVKYVVI
jgi:hypothetical protein